jgi:hypothetical protein
LGRFVTEGAWDEEIVEELKPEPGDYWPILVSDATNPNVPGPTYEATLWNVENLFGWVTTTDELIGAFRA